MASSCGDSGDSGPTYGTVAVDRGPIAARVTATGTLSALVTVQVGSQVSGRIKELLVDFNSTVRTGQLIATIDPQLYAAAVEQARANLSAALGEQRAARAQAGDARRKLERTRALAERKLIAAADLDSAEATLEIAEAQVEALGGRVAQARAALNQAEVNLSLTRIVSPIDGIVVSRAVDVGQTVAASFQAPTLFVLAEDLAKMQVNTSVAEADIGKLRAGMPATFTVDAFPQEVFAGVVRQIRLAAVTVQNVVTYDAVLDVTNPDLRLLPGMTATVSFVTAQRDEVLRIANMALRFKPPAQLARAAAGGGPDQGAGATDAAPRQDQGERWRTVWVVEGGLRPVRVRTGLTDGSLTEVLAGDLRPGMLLATDQPRGGGSGMPGRMRRLF